MKQTGTFCNKLSDRPLFLSYCQQQAEAAAKANRQEEATSWSDAVRLSQLTLDCVNKTAVQQGSWKGSLSWQQAIIHFESATFDFIQSMNTIGQETSSYFKKRAHQLEEAAKLSIKAAEAHRAGREAEGQRLDKEAEEKGSFL